jgi:hypothetical protein
MTAGLSAVVLGCAAGVAWWCSRYRLKIARGFFLTENVFERGERARKVLAKLVACGIVEMLRRVNRTDGPEVDEAATKLRFSTHDEVCYACGYQVASLDGNVHVCARRREVRRFGRVNVRMNG